ncbi:JmjC domain-containing protein [Paraburkholderia diazotrophica]|uniref:JmjC domain-containing protein n=1 Tax=Paraburkholderia diazotrophica TaxID=667676 RepID=UPI00317896B2
MGSLLQFLLGDVQESHFFSDFYGKQPLHIKGAADKFSDLFTLSDLNAILNFSSLLYPRVRVTDHHNTIHKYDLIDDKDRYINNLNNELNRKKVLLAIARGGTLVYDRIHECHSPLETFVDELSEQIRTRVSVNGYYTARGQQGVNVHFDRHDVFAVQIHGSKRWFYREDTHVLARAIRHQPVPPVDAQCTGWKSVLVEQGDVFYCPRGIWHFTRTEERHSAHLAMGWYPLTLGDWIRQLESQPEIAEILEAYVQRPAQDTTQSYDFAALEKLISALRSSARQPEALNAKPRPHLELE